MERIACTRKAHKFPGKTALADEEVSLDFKTVNDRVNRLANGLRAKGVQKGDRIGVLIHNCHQFVEIYYAAAKTGGIFCPYNNHLKQWELKDILDYSTPTFLFVDRDFNEKVLITFPMEHVACEDNIVRHSLLSNAIYTKREGGFNPPEVLDYIAKEGISRIQPVPTMIHSLIQVPDVSRYDRGRRGPLPPPRSLRGRGIFSAIRKGTDFVWHLPVGHGRVFSPEMISTVVLLDWTYWGLIPEDKKGFSVTP